MKDLNILLPKAKVYGIEDHKYPIKNAEKVENDPRFALMLDKLPNPDFVTDSLMSIPNLMNDN